MPGSERSLCAHSLVHAPLTIYSGKLLDQFQASGDVTAGYAILFGICGSAYLVAFALNHLLAPRFESVDIRR
jgi:ACS family hexuronate transporter-like MFS transporter